MSSTKSVEDFKKLVEQHTNDLLARGHRWQEKLEENSKEIGEDVKGQILLAIGQAGLLIKERFSQFSGLIDDCEQQRGELKTTTDDLAGFWDMISMQVDDMNKKFALLDLAEKNQWRLPEDKADATSGSASKSRETANVSHSNGGHVDPHNISFESTDRVKEEAEKSETVKERRNELRSFIAQQKEKQQQGGEGGDGNGELFVDIKAP